MASSPPLLLRILATSAIAAERAGKIIRDVRQRGDLGLVEKSKGDFQTIADRSSEKCIVASLKSKFPDLNVIAEEGENLKGIESDWIVKESDRAILSIKCPQQYTNLLNEDIVVWVDPLDGTSEYIRGSLEYVTVLVGVAIKGKAVGGIIHEPYSKQSYTEGKFGRTIWGIVDFGVGGFKPNDPPPTGLIVLTARSHSIKTVEKSLAALNPGNIIRMGGAGYKVVHLAEGKAHVYLYPSQGCMKWDICAPEAILAAIGGKLTDAHGKQYSYHKDVEHVNKGGVFASGKGVDHDELVAKLPKEVKDVLV